ncbi:hypothetical protein [Bifidobacterium scardovii]|uniref:Uncharacterized protein n=2 Tax=Bifidobacterium scardovii TaxID=158787 RepID=A0A087DI64_9BIFI|nr:hypothetical protein [Bifidobacterium scardovii]KFI95214.1 hypothetical protein BSCA_1032 [Bifidobacterium scardovii]MDK6348705.1 hypothetical protein [Bifidobacterium scardovii]MDU8981317.1 hypothetical protein [Bifidobacterium scardovii]BAQ31599.1 hypothetical protein BBSC_1519 [Bifidobacterium scardovii JCM 12489 = DSM 13734]
MTVLGGNDYRDFTVHRTPDEESPGYPCVFSVALDGHTARRVTKGGLLAMKREINRCLKEEVTRDDRGNHE